MRLDPTFEGSRAPLPPALGGVCVESWLPDPYPSGCPHPRGTKGLLPPLTPSLPLLRVLVLSAEKAVLPLSTLGSPDAPVLYTLLQMPPPRAPCSAQRGLRVYLHPLRDNDLFVT